jgi:hypothetical protein
VHSRVFAPLTVSATVTDRAGRVAEWMNGCAGFVDRAWKAAPESLLWPVIDLHLDRPAGENLPAD